MQTKTKLPPLYRVTRGPVVLRYLSPAGQVATFEGTCRGPVTAQARCVKAHEEVIRFCHASGDLLDLKIDMRLAGATPTFWINGRPFHFAVVDVVT